MAFVPDSLFRNNNDHQDHHSFLSSSSCTPQNFQGVEFFMRRSTSFSGIDRTDQECHDHADDTSDDDGSQIMLGEKKRRLNLEQVKALEKSFELGNKLEPERKLQLARALGLQPRQIAIWFQNRRARYKTKQLERDYGVLKRQFEAIKADNDALKSQNKKLNTQLMVLKSRESSGGTFPFNLNKENEGSWSNETSCEVLNLNTTASLDTTLMHPRLQAANYKDGHLNFCSSSLSQSVDLTQLHQASSREEEYQPVVQACQKIDNHDDHGTTTSDVGLCNVFGGSIEEIPEYWPW